MNDGLSLREIIRKVIEGTLDYQVRFKESKEYSAIFNEIEEIELIEEIIYSIEPKNYYKIPLFIQKKILKESNDEELKDLIRKRIPSNEIHQEFKIWGLNSLINEMSSELFWILTNRKKLPKISFEELINNIKNGVLREFDINQYELLDRLENIPNFYGTDEIQKKIILIGEILKLIERNYSVNVPFNEKFKAFLIRTKIYSDLLVVKFKGSKIFNKRIDNLLKNFNKM